MIYFFLSDLLHSISQSLGPSMSLQKTQFWSFLWLSNIPLYICTSSLLKSFIPEASEPLVELPANSSSKVSLDVNTGLGSPGRLPRTPIIPYPSILQCLSTTYFPFLISWSRFIFELISYHFCLLPIGFKITESPHKRLFATTQSYNYSSSFMGQYAIWEFLLLLMCFLQVYA